MIDGTASQVEYCSYGNSNFFGDVWYLPEKNIEFP